MSKPETYRQTEKFKQAYLKAITAASISDPKDLKNYMRSWSAAFPALHTKPTAEGRVFTGAKISNLLEYLSSKSRLGGECRNHIGPQLQSLVCEGWLEKEEINKYFDVFEYAETLILTKGYIVKDYTTLNIQKHYWQIMQVLEPEEADELVTTFAIEPWLHATSATNTLLYKFLKEHLRLWLSRNCTELPEDVYLVTIKSDKKGLQVQAKTGWEDPSTDVVADVMGWRSIKW